MKGRNDVDRKIRKRVNLVSRAWNWQIVCCNFNFSPIWFKLYAFSLHDCFAIKCLSLYPYVLYTLWRWSFISIFAIIGLRDVGRNGEDAYSQYVLMTHFTLKSCQICIISTHWEMLFQSTEIVFDLGWGKVFNLQANGDHMVIILMLMLKPKMLLFLNSSTKGREAVQLESIYIWSIMKETAKTTK